MKTENARRYLVGRFINDIKDSTFTRYIEKHLAGDFACKIVDFIEKIEGEKPVVDEQKRRISEALISKAITYEAGLCFCEHCHTSAEHFNNIHHEDKCIVTETKRYLKWLEAE